jgi:TPP-dependent indolepyruvate ferredoxin oxidoreductase alpha subunit
MYASYTGLEAGFVLVSADDPAMHSSQNEQDNRRLAAFARIPCLEPSSSQECKDFMRLAFELSERFDTPVMVRTTTRINHSASVVELGDPVELPPKRGKFPRNAEKYVMVPANAASATCWWSGGSRSCAPGRTAPRPRTASNFGVARWASSPPGWLTSTPGRCFPRPRYSSWA